ncbi:MAG TPA: squalene synthase HpnC [Paraburkholderia sp.]
MEADLYEHFPVAKILLPKPLREPVAVIHYFVRTLAEIADEGDWSPIERHARLADFRAGLDALAGGRPAPVHPTLFATLGATMRRHDLPLDPFYQLMSAFEQDVDTMRYANRAALVDYCGRCSTPIGRLMLHLIGSATPENIAESDSICTGLQFIALLRDIPSDWERGRVYLPLADRQRFNVTEAQIAAGIVDDGWRALMRYEIGEARAMIVRGAPLALRVPGRCGLELCSVVHGALRVLERIERADYDVFYHRPVLRTTDRAVVLLRTAAMWLSRRVGVGMPSVEGNA